MDSQNGLSGKDKAAQCGAPQSRREIDEMLARCAPSSVTAFLRRWLDLEEDLQQIQMQASHVRDELGDKLLGNLLTDRANQLRETLIRRAGDLTRMPSVQVGDIGAKVYVLSRIETLAAEASLYQAICQSVLDDVRSLGVCIDRFQDGE